MKAYIDVIDLLILSYYDRILCFNVKNEYSMTNSSNICKNKSQIIRFLNTLEGKTDNHFIAELSQKDIRILHQWGHGLDKNGKQLYKNHLPYFMIESKSNLKYQRSNLFGDEIKTALNFILKSTKLVAGVLAIVGSGGAGGDTIVSAISATINSGIFMDNLMTSLRNLGENNQYLKQILELRFNQGPEDVNKKTITIMKQMASDGHIELLETMCPPLNEILENIAMIVGDWISTFIPDSAGTVGLLIEEIIESNAGDSYERLVKLFNMLPNSAQDLFKDSQKMSEFLIGILNFLKETLTQDNQSMSLTGTGERFLKSSMTMMVPGMRLLQRSNYDKVMFTKIFDVISKYYEPNINKAVRVLEKVMPLTFSILTINKFCENPDLLTQPVVLKETSVSNRSIGKTQRRVPNRSIEKIETPVPNRSSKKMENLFFDRSSKKIETPIGEIDQYLIPSSVQKTLSTYNELQKRKKNMESITNSIMSGGRSHQCHREQFHDNCQYNLDDYITHIKRQHL